MHVTDFNCACNFSLFDFNHILQLVYDYTYILYDIKYNYFITAIFFCVKCRQNSRRFFDSRYERT